MRQVVDHWVETTVVSMMQSLRRSTQWIPTGTTIYTLQEVYRQALENYLYNNGIVYSALEIEFRPLSTVVIVTAYGSEYRLED